MSDENSLIKIENLTGLSEPADTLIKKISSAIGGIFKPWQIRRVASAEADAEQIKTISKIEMNELENRALRRFLYEESRNQNNIECITSKALSQLNTSAKPEQIDNDWITNFFDKCRLISDEDMQTIWSKILAGEANAPGRFSKRTINFLESLDKKDAQLFTNLCAFNWMIGNIQPLIYDLNDKIYTDNGINFSNLKHLDSIGLISFENLTGYIRQGYTQTAMFLYKNTPYSLKFPKEKDNDLSIGNVILTNIGKELASICAPTTINDFDNYIIQRWVTQGIEITKINS